MQRYPNFDFLRLAAALAVIFSHAFLIAEGTQKNEPFVLLTGNQSILGLLGVFVFFVISGFLVTQSFEASASPQRFAAARALRIFPGLGVCLLICTFVIGAGMTQLPLGEYLARPRTWHFLIENLLVQRSDETLPGVTFIDNPVGGVVNGTMWTLRYEVHCYVMVLVLGALRLLNARTALMVLAASFLTNLFDLDDFFGGFLRSGFDGLGPIGYFANKAFDLDGFLWLLPPFGAGMAMYYLHQRMRLRGALAVLAGAAILAAAVFGKLLLVFPLGAAYLVIYLATHPTLRLPAAARFGDLSYGLYIYGWPAEELVAYWRGGEASWVEVFALGLALGAAFAFLSWHLVEKHALRLKPRRAAVKPAPRPAAVEALEPG